MLNSWINTKKAWYVNFNAATPEVDGNGDYTGEVTSGYNPVQMTRATFSGARGNVHDDLFGLSMSYTKTMSTAKMDLGIDERSLIWDTEPTVFLDTEHLHPDPETATYRVVGVARGHYHIHYALQQMSVSDNA